MKRTTSRLRELLRSEETLVAPGAYDPLTGRVIEAAGFDAVYVGGYTTGAHTCTTEPLMTITEQIHVGERIARSVSVPVLVDGHTGGGNAAHAARTVREFEAAGVAGIHIEDQVYPKSLSYHHGVKEVIPLDEAVRALRVAQNARSDPDFLVIARTDAWGASNGGLDETIRRMDAFANAGAEALMPLAFDPDDAAAISKAVPEVPMVWLAGLGGTAGMKEMADSEGKGRGYPELSIEDVRELGYEIVLYPVATIIAAVGAVNALVAEIRDKRVCDFEGFAEANDLIRNLVQVDDLYAIESGATT